LINLELGTVFRWNNFPDARYGEKDKARWFICVGFSGIFAQVAEVFLCTTTTQLEAFKDPKRRKGHNHHIFKTKPFDSECAIDFFEAPYSITQDKIDKLQNDIEIKGKLDKNILTLIYNSLYLSCNISPMELNDIHTSYNNAGITGLKKPKLSKK
jgi:hypothetical protein